MNSLSTKWNKWRGVTQTISSHSNTELTTFLLQQQHRQWSLLSVVCHVLNWSMSRSAGQCCFWYCLYKTRGGYGSSIVLTPTWCTVRPVQVCCRITTIESCCNTKLYFLMSLICTFQTHIFQCRVREPQHVCQILFGTGRWNKQLIG